MKLKEIFTAAEMQETDLQRVLALGSPEGKQTKTFITPESTEMIKNLSPVNYICLYFYFIWLSLIKQKFSTLDILVHVNV